MKHKLFYQDLITSISEGNKGLAILIDPEKFSISETNSFLKKIPKKTTHIFVGGSTIANGCVEKTINVFKEHTNLPVFLFPGDHSQITNSADAILFLSLLSGRNAEYLIGQQVKSVSVLINLSLEIIPTGYLLLDGGNESAVARVSKTLPMNQDNIDFIVHTALAGQYMGAKLIYLEAGSGAKNPIKPEVIKAVKNAIELPLIVGGGIKTQEQKELAYNSGADMVVMGTAFE